MDEVLKRRKSKILRESYVIRNTRTNQNVSSSVNMLKTRPSLDKKTIYKHVKTIKKNETVEKEKPVENIVKTEKTEEPVTEIKTESNVKLVDNGEKMVEDGKTYFEFTLCDGKVGNSKHGLRFKGGYNSKGSAFDIYTTNLNETVNGVYFDIKNNEKKEEMCIVTNEKIIIKVVGDSNHLVSSNLLYPKENVIHLSKTHEIYDNYRVIFTKLYNSTSTIEVNCMYFK